MKKRYRAYVFRGWSGSMTAFPKEIICWAYSPMDAAHVAVNLEKKHNFLKVKRHFDRYGGDILVYGPRGSYIYDVIQD